MIRQLYSTLMLENPDWRSIFSPQGKILRQGDLIRRTNLSRTLHTIAEDGAEAFYSVRSITATPLATGR